MPEPLRVAAALIVDDDGRFFFQRRSAQRRLFPNLWDVVGGHLEGDESVYEALDREVTEETGWRISVVLGLVGEYAYTGDDGIDRVETDFLIRVDGDLARPRLEAGKVTEFRWLGEDELDVLEVNREVDGGLLRKLAEDGFATLHAIGL